MAADDPNEPLQAELAPADNPFRENPYVSPTAHTQTTADLGENLGMRMIMPVGRSLWAIAAGYLALFVPCMFVTGPLALVCGIMAIREIRRDPTKHGLGRAWFGIIVGTLGTIMLVAMLFVMVVGLMAER